MAKTRTRHILSLSGGKDSTALAVYMRDRIPDLEYVFCDTEKELPETYRYIDLLEAYLGKRIVRLKHDGRGFDHWLAIYGNYLPSMQARWCTRHLKIQPFEQYVLDDNVVSYVGIRADENRTGYVSTKPNIEARFPFKEDGIDRQGVLRILSESGLGLADYYRWRSRSGCYFCFFQQKIEWVGLLENYPELYAAAMAYEKTSSDGLTQFTWNSDESLLQLSQPERVEAIKAEHSRRLGHAKSRRANQSLLSVLTESDVFPGALDDFGLDSMCIACR